MRTLTLARAGDGAASVSVDGRAVFESTAEATAVDVSLNRGINKVVVTGTGGTTHLDTLRVSDPSAEPDAAVVQAESGTLSGSAEIRDLPNAADGKAVDGIGGAPGNGNTLTLTVEAAEAGAHALRVRYSNPDQSAASHYNPDTISRHGDVSVNGGDPVRFWVPSTFHANNFWETTVVVDLVAGENELTFSSEELPTPEGTLLSEDRPDWQLNSAFAPVLDQIGVAPLRADASAPAAIDASATTAWRCVAGKPALVVTVRNNDDTPVGATAASDLGTKTFASIAAGKRASHAFTARSASVEEGTVSVRLTADADGEPVSRDIEAAYPAASCE